MSRNLDLYDAAVAFCIAALAIGLMVWSGIHLIRYSYGTGYIDGTRTGFASGAKAARRTAYAGCAQWGKWGNERVVICKENVK